MTATTSAGRGIIAAGQRLHASDSTNLRSLRQGWQDEAWDYYHTCQQLKFAARFVANALAKISLFVAVQPDPRAQPVPWDPDNAELRGIIDPTIANRAVEMLDELWSPLGGQTAIQSEISLNLEVAGEAYLGEREDGFGWDVWSIAELTSDSTGYRLKSRPSDSGTPINPDERFVARLWSPDPQWSDLPESFFQGVLGDAEALLMLTRQVRGEAASRLNAGVWLLPDTLKAQAGDPTADQNEDDDPFATDLETALIEPIEMLGSARSVAPLVLWIPDETLEKMSGDHHLTFDRPSDQWLEERIAQRVEHVAQGLDLPIEVVQGKYRSTFANADQVDRDVFDDHLEHRCIRLVDAITAGYLIDRLTSEDESLTPLDLRPLRTWFDPSALLRNPAEKDDAFRGHEALVVSDDFLRRRIGATEEDAPEDEEMERRTALRKGIMTAELTAELLRRTIAPDFPDDIPPPPASRGGPVVAAANGHRDTLGRLSGRLADIDAGLLTRVLADADSAVRETLRAIGGRLRGQISGAERELVASVPLERVAATLGRALVAQAGEPVGDEIAAMLEERLGGRFERRVAAAQREALTEVTAALGAPPDDVLSRVESEQADDRSAAAAMLVASLAVVVTDRLYTPDVTPPEVGELDDTLVTPPAAVRQALARAGGATALVEGAGGSVLTQGGARPAGGVATGDRLLALLAEAYRAVVSGWRWRYGDPGSRTRPFDPHRVLDGTVVESWDDDALANPGIWPPVAHFRPSDHRGCLCGFEAVLILPDAAGGEQ